MEKDKLKSLLLMITYAIGLVLVVVRIEDILHAIGFFLRLLKPLLFGIVIAFVLNRPYEWFRGWYQRKWHLSPKKAKVCGILSVYLASLGGLTLVVCMVGPELVRNIQTFIASADDYMLEFQTFLNQLTDALGFSRIDLSLLIQMIDEYLGTLSQLVNELLPQIIEVTASVISGATTAFISLALSIYIMSGKTRLMAQVRRTLNVYLPRRILDRFESVGQTIYTVFENYVAGQCKEAVILGSLCFVGMMILRIDYAGLISVIIATTALIPILGAYVGGTVGVLLLLFSSPGKALLFLVFLIVLQQVEGNVIYPRVVGRKIGLPGMWVLLAISVGGGLFGVWGMLIGVPVTTVLYLLLKKDVSRREQK